MIKSLYEINTSLQNLRKQLINNSSNHVIKQCIDKLMSEVKYLDEEQKSNYYFLISEIYATKFQNISQALIQLKNFDHSLDTQIYMNCQFRFALYNYFQLNYKQANKHLDVALGYVQEELKLTSNAKFFFNRIINKQNLQTQAKQNNNFEAGFMLSLVYENEKNETSGLKLIESFLQRELDNFQKYQLYKRLLQLYEIMKKNSISTISISKKSLETYKQNLNDIRNRNQKYDQEYIMKVDFVKKIIEFMDKSNKQKNQRNQRRLLDLKLLAYYKLKKCSKLAPNKQIKLTLMNSAKLIKDSKDTQLLEETLNYDFVQSQYNKFKILYKYTARQSLLKWQFFNNIANNSPRKQTKSILKSGKTSMQNSKSINTLRSTKNQPQYTKVVSENSIKPKQASYKQIQPEQQQFNDMKQTTSQLLDDNFQGSMMVKINASSQGYEERYFYIKPESVIQKPKLFYCESINKKNQNDSYYSLKGLKEISIGKQTEAFQRKDTAKFNPGQCFSLIFQSGKDRNFYVPKFQDFQKWIFMIQAKLVESASNLSKMKSTSVFSKGPKSNLKQSLPMKKSRKVVQFD